MASPTSSLLTKLESSRKGRLKICRWYVHTSIYLTKDLPMSTITGIRLHTGDVIEVAVNGTTHSALVLLAAHDMAVLDLCDGSTPIVVKAEELGDVRVFDGLAA